MKWLEGHKTYIAAAILMFIACAGYLYSLMSGSVAGILLAMALGYIGVGHKVERYSQAILAELDEIKRIQGDLRAGKRQAAIAEGETAIGIGMAALEAPDSATATAAKAAAK